MSARLSRPRFTPMTLNVLAVLLVIIGLVALLLPVPPSPPRAMGVATSSSVPYARDVRTDSNVARVVRSNLFSASRRAPTVRFVLPGQEPAAALNAFPVAVAEMVAFDAPVLHGVMTVDGVRRALIRFPGMDSVPRVVRVGDRAAGYRVRSIGADRVELSSSAGTRTVRLLRRIPSDSGEPEL